MINKKLTRNPLNIRNPLSTFLPTRFFWQKLVILQWLRFIVLSLKLKGHPGFLECILEPTTFSVGQTWLKILKTNTTEVSHAYVHKKILSFIIRSVKTKPQHLYKRTPDIKLVFTGRINISEQQILTLLSLNGYSRWSAASWNKKPRFPTEEIKPVVLRESEFKSIIFNGFFGLFALSRLQ